MSLSLRLYAPSPGVVKGLEFLGRGPRSIMQEILKTIGDLVLGSVPTVIAFLILLAAYQILVRKPLEKTLADRHGRTGGAMDEAKAAIASAEAKTAEYESKLRAARSQIFESRTARAKAATAARDKAIADAREAAQHRITVARESVERSGAEAKAQLEAGAASLSQSVLAAILPHRSGMGAV
ncbi:hypothetical protein [Terriglobus roseus]|uniref:ATP synthase subunit b n=1 Tax=Terriglobus roseus TaxID=392734 RepID=A0A1H4Q707_9BACT|nr:hypothetical protein [Terriglobus roseus]SEC15404.1 F-type H+-transporting ATPase subunit b [Terriglobus roseus]